VDKNCNNYGSSWCADFECAECPVRDIEPKPDDDLVEGYEETVSEDILEIAKVVRICPASDIEPKPNDTEEALQRYIDGLISKERLAEEIGVNYHVLYGALIKGCQRIEPTPDDRLLTDTLLREAIAELEHMQWMAWAGALEQIETLSENRLKRWHKLYKPYSNLTEEEKAQDRIWADKVIAKTASIYQEKMKKLFEEIHNIFEDVLPVPQPYEAVPMVKVKRIWFRLQSLKDRLGEKQ